MLRSFLKTIPRPFKQLNYMIARPMIFKLFSKDSPQQITNMTEFNNYTKAASKPIIIAFYSR